MKTKRILFGVLLPILALTLSACDFLPTDLFGGKSSSEQSSSRRIRSGSSSTNKSSYPSGHVHKFSEDWSYNSQYHWHDSTCGHDVKSDVTPHTIQSHIIKEATCIETGLKTDFCPVCNYEETVVIPTTGHDWVEYERKDATCTEAGYSKRNCALCGVYTQVELPALGHEFEEEIIQAATCTQDGIIKRRCTKCDYTEQVTVPNYGHEFTPIYRQEPTCTSAGLERYECTRCGEVLEYVVPSSGHEWSGNEEVVETGKGITYFTDTCMNCGAKKIALPTTAGNINGSIKESIANSYGYIKLNSNGDSISIDFYYPESTYVRVYQHAVYDYWQKSNYSTFTYRTTSSSGSSNGDYNFSLSVNSQIVDLTEASNYTYQDFFGSSPKYIEELLDQGFSPMADCLIGDAQLREGMNNLTYTRLAAYTFNIDCFVLVISDGAHEHTLSPTIYSDDNYHWRQCTDPNCPLYDGIVDKTPHEYYQYSIGQGESCSDSVEVTYACSVCGHRTYAYATSEHIYDPSAVSYVTNSDSYQQSINHCDICHKTVQAYQFSVGKVTAGSYESGRMKQGTTMEWKFPVSKTGVVSLYIPIYVATQTYLTKTFDPSLYNLAFNGVNYEIYAQYGLYQDLGVKVNEVIYLKFGSYQVTEYDVNTSEITVSLTSNVSEYRPYLDGEIRLEY